MSYRYCFVNCSAYPAITASDQLLADYLLDKNCLVEVQSWDDESVDWTGYDKLIIRATWNYHTQADKFLAWLDKVELQEIPAINPPHILRWNMDKRYLRDLIKQGISIPPTVWLEAGEKASLADILYKNHWKSAVIKPCISATAMNTVSLTLSTAKDYQAQFDDWIQDAAYMVQVFMPQIIKQGEWSLMFFNGQFSHAVIKRAQKGDFRVQSDFGGQVIPMTPSDKLIQQAENILAGIKSPLAYARVDGIETADGDFVLMELELIEPELFFTDVPSAVGNFATAILNF